MLIRGNCCRKCDDGNGAVTKRVGLADDTARLGWGAPHMEAGPWRGCRERQGGGLPASSSTFVPILARIFP